VLERPARGPDERMNGARSSRSETRVSMLVGVAVGLELGHLLFDSTTTPEDEP
jgi:hypothetical protein